MNPFSTDPELRRTQIIVAACLGFVGLLFMVGLGLIIYGAT